MRPEDDNGFSEYGYNTYTADDEMPDCGRCDHICDSQSICDKCGPEYGWYNYRRTTPKTDLDVLFEQFLRR